jgi:membrane associated rhomboid family serine protease
MADERERVRQWALVLDSQGIPYEIDRAADGWQLVVAPAHAEEAAAALAAYARENPAPRPAAEEETPRAHGGRLTPAVPIAAAVGLAAFHLVTGPWSAGGRWFAAGAADAAAIRDGEVWRTVTALTLHADVAHVLANGVTLALFGTALASVVGAGAALALAVASGAAGNAINVAARSSAYSGVGASTAVFGCVGALVGAQMTGRDRNRPGRWTALFSGVMLLVLLGSGQNTDVMAHALGFAAGTALGAVWGRWAPEAPSMRAQALLLSAGGLLVVVSWWLARTGAGAG